MTNREWRLATDRGRGSFGERLQAVDLVFEHRGREVAGDGPFPCGPRPGVPRPSTMTTANPWSASHCAFRYAPREAITRCACGPP